ncbi:transposase, partial [Acetivibrio clariflavus]
MKRQEISVEKLLGIIEEKDRRIAELEQQVQWFMEQIRLSKRKQFGVSSEQTKIEQINLFNNEEEETHNLAITEQERIEVK